MQKCDITKAAQKELKSYILERLLMCSPGYRGSRGSRSNQVG